MFRPSVILMAALLALNAVIGVGPVDVTICLGHLHDHDRSVPTVPDHGSIAHACGHGHDDPCGSDGGWNLHPDDHGCCCHDVDLPDVNLMATPRTSESAPVLAPAAFAPLPLCDGADDATSRLRPPPRLGFDPGRDARLACARTVRLII